MTVQRVLALVVVLGVLAAALVATVRATAVRPQKAVEIALHLQAVRESSTTQAFPFDALLQEYRKAGVTTLLVGGTTLQGLLDYGATGYPGDDPVLVAVKGGQITVRNNPKLADWLQGRLAARLGRGRVEASPRGEAVELNVAGVTEVQLKGLPLGVHPADLNLAQRMGWRVAVHYSQGLAGLDDQVLLEGLPPGAGILWTGAAGPSAALQARMKQRGDLLLIDHSQPPFSEGMAPGTASAFEQLGGRALKLFRVTFSHTAGDIMTAVKERNMQVVLLQPYHLTGDLGRDVAGQTAAWAAMAKDLQAAGYNLGQASPLQPYAPPLWAYLAAGAAVGAAAALLVPLSGWAAAALMFLGAAGALAPWELARQALAFGAAAVLPALGALRALEAPTLLRRLGWLAGAAFAGGLLVTAVLGDVRYVYELSLFRGIKVALVAPSAAFVAVLAWRERAALAGWLQGRSLRVWHLAVGLIVLTALPLMLIRSGQEFELLLVSGLELKLRSLLEQVLVVRPRFKEFLVGWPLLVLAHAALQRHCRLVGGALLAMGLIAPASLINSFTHLHTPMWMSAVRGIHGLWIGTLLGGLLVLALRRWKGERHV